MQMEYNKYSPSYQGEDSVKRVKTWMSLTEASLNIYDRRLCMSQNVLSKMKHFSVSAVQLTGKLLKEVKTNSLKNTLVSIENIKLKQKM